LPRKLYSLLCWNLLSPDKQPEEVQIPIVQQIEEKTRLSLNLPIGVYHIQLISGQNVIDNIGWWCVNNQSDILSKVPLGEKSRENYWYTVLDNNASPENFIENIKKSKLKFDIDKVKRGITSLEKQQYYFPNLLKPEILLSKLKKLLEFLENPPIVPPVKPSSSTWYLLYITTKKRDVFKSLLEKEITKKELQNIIVAVEVPKDSVYENILLLNLDNYEKAYPHLRKPLSLQQVSKMLGGKYSIS
jgi:hypothetical protein